MLVREMLVSVVVFRSSIEVLVHVLLVVPVLAGCVLVIRVVLIVTVCVIEMVVAVSDPRGDAGLDCVIKR